MCSPPLKQGPNGYNAPKQLPSAMVLKSYTNRDTRGSETHTSLCTWSGSYRRPQEGRGRSVRGMDSDRFPIRYDSSSPLVFAGCPTRRPICYHCHRTDVSSPTVFPQSATSDSLSASCDCMSNTSRCLLEESTWITHTHTHTHLRVPTVIVPLTITWPLCVWIYLHNNWGLVFLATEQLSAQINAELCCCTPRLTATHARPSPLWQAHTWHVLELHHSQPERAQRIRGSGYWRYRSILWCYFWCCSKNKLNVFLNSNPNSITNHLKPVTDFQSRLSSVCIGRSQSDYDTVAMLWFLVAETTLASTATVPWEHGGFSEAFWCHDPALWYTRENMRDLVLNTVWPDLPSRWISLVESGGEPSYL